MRPRCVARTAPCPRPGDCSGAGGRRPLGARAGVGLLSLPYHTPCPRGARGPRPHGERQRRPAWPRRHQFPLGRPDGDALRLAPRKPSIRGALVGGCWALLRLRRRRRSPGEHGEVARLRPVAVACAAPSVILSSPSPTPRPHVVHPHASAWHHQPRMMLHSGSGISLARLRPLLLPQTHDPRFARHALVCVPPLLPLENAPGSWTVAAWSWCRAGRGSDRIDMDCYSGSFPRIKLN